jgi:hypothetical protein
LKNTLKKRVISLEEEIPQVTVLLSDLEIIRAALSSAYYQNETLDISDQYRKLSNRPQPSPMTKALQGAVAKVDNYIKIATIDEEELTDE